MSDLRYIPARAGEAEERGECPEPRAVHPRACGGSVGLHPVRQHGAGTSPRVRGKLFVAPAGGVCRGYIPARAGEAQGHGVLPPTARVHPRACGGSELGYRPGSEQGGTSPRVRGKPVGLHPVRQPRGYIPARAGEALDVERPADQASVHPRACGGSPPRPRFRSSPSGTSPRVRGKRCTTKSSSVWERYIPARAGEAAQD